MGERESGGNAVRDLGRGESMWGRRGGGWFWVARCVPGGRREIVNIEKGAGEEIPGLCFLMFNESDVN